MADLEKVIKETKDGIAFAESRGFGGLANTMRDALELLKEQEKEIDEISDEYLDLGNEMAKQPKPKTGHWVVLTMCANEGTYCSECSTKVFDFVHPPKKKLSQYCPHCGAKMDEKYDPWED